VYAGQRSGTYVAPAHATANGDGVVVGNGARTVEVYLDFMCPHCRDFEDSAGTTLNQMVAGGRIRLVYHPVAFLDRLPTTQYSTRSAAASGCASDAGRYPDFVKVMFANQPAEGGAGLSDDEIIRLAGTAGG
jgi:protein-disulfide isomerase